MGGIDKEPEDIKRLNKFKRLIRNALKNENVKVSFHESNVKDNWY